MKNALIISSLALALMACASPSETNTGSEAAKPGSEQVEKRHKRPKRADGEARGERGERGERRKPPQEAFDVCSGKAEGDSCIVNTPRGEIESTCRKTPRSDTQLLCAPTRPRR